MDSQRKSLGQEDMNLEPVLRTILISEKPYQRVKHLIFLVSCLCLSPFYYGFTLTYISTINDHTLKVYFGPEAARSVMIGILIGIVPAGAGVGALLAPFFMTLFTRRNFLLFFNAVAILVSGIIQINQLGVLLGCRFVQGFIIGNYMGVVPIYIKQLTPIPLRGSMGALSQFFNIGAVVICYLIGLIFNLTEINQEFYWRFMFSFTAIIVIVQSALLLAGVIPESPSSLIEIGKLKQAKKVLALFNSPHVLDNVFSQYIQQSRRNKFKIRYKRKQNVKLGRRPQNFSVELSLHRSSQPKSLVFKIQDDVEQKSKKQVNILMSPSLSKQGSLKSDEYSIQIESIRTDSQVETGVEEKLKISIKAFIIGFELPLMQQFSGVKTIVTEIGVIIKQYDQGLSLYSPFLINLVQLAATACSIFVLARFGRRSIILFGNFGVALCSLAVAFFFLAIVLTGSHELVFGAMGFIVIFMIIYGLSIGPAVWLYVPEIIPPKIVPPATFMNWLGVTISVVVTPIVLEKVGSPYPVFLFFGCISLFFWGINYFLVIQTKGLQPSEISQKLS